MNKNIRSRRGCRVNADSDSVLQLSICLKCCHCPVVVYSGAHHSSVHQSWFAFQFIRRGNWILHWIFGWHWMNQMRWVTAGEERREVHTGCAGARAGARECGSQAKLKPKSRVKSNKRVVGSRRKRSEVKWEGTDLSNDGSRSMGWFVYFPIAEGQSLKWFLDGIWDHWVECTRFLLSSAPMHTHSHLMRQLQLRRWRCRWPQPQLMMMTHYEWLGHTLMIRYHWIQSVRVLVLVPIETAIALHTHTSWEWFRSSDGDAGGGALLASTVVHHSSRLLCECESVLLWCPRQRRSVCSCEQKRESEWVSTRRLSEASGGGGNWDWDWSWERERG